MIQWRLSICLLVPLPFLNPACASESHQFTHCWSLAWRILSITLLECEMSATVQWFEHSLIQTCFILWCCPVWDWNENWPFFQSCGHCWVFQIYWHIECSTQYALLTDKRKQFTRSYILSSILEESQEGDGEKQVMALSGHRIFMSSLGIFCIPGNIISWHGGHNYNHFPIEQFSMRKKLQLFGNDRIDFLR